jgi:peroxiredoxin
MLAAPSFAAASFPSDKLLPDGLPPGVHTLRIGDRAPDFSLRGVDGRTYTLASFRDADLLMVVFMSNHCAVSHAAETRLFPYLTEMKRRGVSLAAVAVNPNNPDALRIEELDFSPYNDSYEEMKRYARDRQFPLPYLDDGATQVTAKAYGCLCTPHVFVFDRQRRLRYTGRFDNSRLPELATVTQSDAPDAIAALLAGKPVPVPVTRAVGCSTKWKLKSVDVAYANAAWEHTPVTVEPIDTAGAAALARNDTKQLRVINFWATWCVPCVHEFPGLVSLTRQFAARPFEMITISLDEPGAQAKVARFLEAQHAAVPDASREAVRTEGRATNNYLFTGANPDALAQAIDPQWPGPLPYTVVIAPGGKIVYRHSGELDLDAMRALVVDNLGRYYDEARIHAVR